MPSNQQEFYDQLKQETEAKVKTYENFQAQIEQEKAESAEKVKGLKSDMKFLAKQIGADNKLLTAQGKEAVEFKG